MVRFTPLLVSLCLITAACGRQDATPVEPTSAAQATASTDTTDTPNSAPSTIAPAETSRSETTAGSVPVAPSDTSSEPGGAIAATSAKLGESLLSRTLEVDRQHSSAQFEAVMSFTGPDAAGTDQTVSFTMTGAYDLATDSVEMSMDLGPFIEAGAALDDTVTAAELESMRAVFGDPIEIVTIGNQAWMKWGFFGIIGVPEGKWIAMDEGDSTDVTGDFGFTGSGSPVDFLESLTDAEAEVTELGSETIRGVETTHYRAIVDNDAIAANLSAEELKDFQKNLGAETTTDFPIDFWLDSDGLIRRYSIDVTDPAFQVEADEELEAGSIVFEIWGYGEDPDIQPPAAADIVSDEELGFNFGD